MRLLLASALLAGAAVAQSAVATVNDPISPGTLGDNLLSLDEAIRVVNGTLALGQLSAPERAQITGSGVPTIIRIDAATTAKITLQQDLTALDGPAAGVDVAIQGVNGRPTLDASGRGHALRIRTNHADVTNLALHNGTDGIVADTSVHFQMARAMLLDGLELDGQTGAGIRLSTAPGNSTDVPVMFSHSVCRSLADAIVIDDRADAASVMLDVEYVEFDGVQRAADIFVDGQGSMTRCRMWRSNMPNGDQIARERRGPTSDKRIMLMIVAGEFTTMGDAVDALGSPLIEVAIHVHHCVIRPAAGRHAFLVGPSDARIDWHLSENIVYGDITIAEGRLNRRLWAWNNVFRDGTFAVDNQGTTTSLRWNRFERCTIRALPGNAAQMKHSSSEFVGCTVDGQATLGEVLLENCWLSSTTLTGNASQQSPAPSPWLSDTWASTETPAVGGYVDLTLDIPPGLLGVWELGLPNKQVVLTQEPWREYALPSVRLQVPGFWAFRSTVRLPVPLNPALVGVEIYCIATTAPYLGQTHVPQFNRPRGVYLTITR